MIKNIMSIEFKGKKAIVAFVCVILFAIFLARIASIASNTSYENKQRILKQNARFITMEKFNINGGYDQLTIVEDKETKILYLWSNSSSNGGLTPWLDKDGKPMKGPEE